MSEVEVEVKRELIGSDTRVIDTPGCETKQVDSVCCLLPKEVVALTGGRNITLWGYHEAILMQVLSV